MGKISQKQWTTVSLEALGLRSGSGPKDVHGAAYGMDDGVTGMAALRPPSSWDQTLFNTLNAILSFPGANQRTLLIVKGARGVGERYSSRTGSTFPKCNRIQENPETVVASVSLEGFAPADGEGEPKQAKIEALADWVLSKIPN